MRKIFVFVLLIALAGGMGGCVKEVVKPQTANEAMITAAAMLKEVSDAHKQFTTDVLLYYQLGVFTVEEKTEIAKASRKALTSIRQAQYELEAASAVLDMKSLQDIQEISIPKAREILHDAIILYIKYGGEVR